MNLRIELKNGVMTAAMRGDLDHHAAAGLREEIDSTAKKVRPKVLRLDFSEVPFMDSSGIGLILGRVRMAALWNGRVAVTGLSPSCGAWRSFPASRPLPRWRIRQRRM